jgi:hypothetical protein
MRKAIINALSFMAATYTVSFFCGHGVNTWQYWVVFASLLVIQVNSQID